MLLFCIPPRITQIVHIKLVVIIVIVISLVMYIRHYHYVSLVLVDSFSKLRFPKAYERKNLLMESISRNQLKIYKKVPFPHIF